MKTKTPYTVRPSHFGGKWVSESPQGISVQHETKDAAVTYAQKRSEKVIYTLPKR